MIRRLAPVVLALALLAPGSVASAGPDQLPNLRPRRPFEIHVNLADGTSYYNPIYALRFSTAVANPSGHDFDLLGVPNPSGDPLNATAQAEQCVKWLGDVCLSRQTVGTFAWHAAHGHMHFDDFAMYELRGLDTSGQPDMSAEGLVAGGEKVSFCLEDVARSEETAGDGNRVYATCSGFSQGISAGWADVYSWWLPGQQILLEGVPDGRYALVITVDPLGQLLESDISDNVSYALIELLEDGTKVKVLPS